MISAASYATAATAGIIGGWTFAVIWARLAPMSIQGQFWSTLTSVGKSMLVAEHSHEFLNLYRRLGAALVRYLGRNIGGVILGCLPLIALLGVLAAAGFDPWPDDAHWQLLFFGMATVGVVGAMIWRRRA